MKTFDINELEQEVQKFLNEKTNGDYRVRAELVLHNFMDHLKHEPLRKLRDGWERENNKTIKRG